jgi:hypothetical protein
VHRDTWNSERIPRRIETAMDLNRLCSLMERGKGQRWEEGGKVYGNA